MKHKNIRFIPQTNRVLEAELSKMDSTLIRQWVREATEELEFQIRYAELDRTKALQGALRLCYDIAEILDN